MKKIGSLLMAVCICVLAVSALSSCGSKKVVGQGSEPDVFEIEYVADSVNAPLKYITFGKDSKGNLHYTVITHYSEHDVSEEWVYKKESAANTYKRYKYNEDENKYEFVNEFTGLYNLPHVDYFAQGWVNKNDLSFKGYTYSEIDVSGVEAEDEAKDLYAELGCKFYKYSKSGEDVYAIMAVYPELDIVLYYGTNLYGDGYQTEFVVKDFKLDQKGNYTDLLK